MKYELVEDFKKDIVREKNFRAIIIASFGVVGSKVDGIIWLVIQVVGIIGVLVANKYLHNIARSADIVLLLHDWGLGGLTFSAAVLGFLIAGFAVFATVTRPSIFKAMARIKRKDRPISNFKFVFFNFLYIFVNYFIYLILSVLIYMGCGANSVITPLIDGLNFEQHWVALWLAFGCVTFASYTFFVLLLLRGFMWNLYQGLLLAIFDEGEEIKKAEI